MEITKHPNNKPKLSLTSPPAQTSSLESTIPHQDRFEAQVHDKASSLVSWAQASRAFFLLGLSALGASCASQPQLAHHESLATKVDTSRERLDLRRSKNQDSAPVTKPASKPSSTPKPEPRQTSSRGHSVRSDGSVGIRVSERVTVRDDSSVEVKVNETTRVSSDGRVIQKLSNGLSFDSEGNVYFEH